MTSSSKAHWWPATAASSTPACNRRWHEMTMGHRFLANVNRDIHPMRARSPSPLRGGVRGGGKPQGVRLEVHPTPNPSPSRGGEFGRRVGRAAMLIATLLIALPHTALASGGGDVDPFVYRFMVFVIAIFVGYFVVW